VNYTILPARLDRTQVAKILGFKEDNISLLASAGLLEPLGNPAPNAPKLFARSEIEEKAQDREWLHKATKALSTYWKRKNARKAAHCANKPELVEA
jgi:hypothetical protein